MDIHKWLNETVLPQQPPSPAVDQAVENGLRVEQVEPVHKEKRRQEQSTSDSSLLDDPPPRRKKVVLPDRGNTIEDDADGSGHTDASHSTSRSASSVTSEPYRRKPRRKTRPERYEPIHRDTKQQGTDTRHHRKDESKKTRRRSRRMKAEKPGSGIVQSFQAKNVPRNRLTLKPREKLGLFSKGRVSSPVKGRGLPDLVFSEMRFLQKHKDQPEADPQPGSPKKKRKKDQAHAKEDEISAYFTSVRPALAEQDSNTQAKKRSHQQLRGNNRSEQEPSSAVDHAVPTVKPADKTPYLGFGGRGPRRENGSYISWSESIRAPSATPARLRVESAVNGGQLDSAHGGQETGNTDSGEVLHSWRPAPPTVTKNLTDDSGGRFQVSSLPPTNERLSRSHSLPQHTSSPRRINLVDRAARRRTLETVASPWSMPPFVSTREDRRRGKLQQSHVHFIYEPRKQIHSVQVQEDPDRQDNSDERENNQRIYEEEGDQQTSSSLGRILQECNSAFHKRRKADAQQLNIEEHPSALPGPDVLRSRSGLYPTIRRIPTVRFAGVEDVYRPNTSMISGPNIYKQQEQRHCEIADPTFYPGETFAVSNVVQDEYVDEEEYDYGGHEWHEGAELEHSGVIPDTSLGEELGPQDMDEDFEEILPSRSNVVPKPGFWRPNKLY